MTTSKISIYTPTSPLARSHQCNISIEPLYEPEIPTEHAVD
jgi:hypothetical protein